MDEVQGEKLAVIIEDDADVRHLLKTVLTQSGFQTILTSNGADGVEAVRTYNPVLTTLDVSMPGMDGFAAAKRIREFSGTYIVMLTALADEIDIVQGLDSGADDYLLKPFRPRELRARVDTMMRRPRERVGLTAAAQIEPAREVQLVSGNPLPHVAVPAASVAAPAPVVHAAPPLVEMAPPVQAAPVHYQQPAAPAHYQQPAAPVHQQPAARQAQPSSRPAPQAPVVQHTARQPVHEPAPAYTPPSPGHPQPVAGQMTEGMLTHRGLLLNTQTRLTEVDGQSVELTRSEFDLLATLLGSGRRVRSKADLVLALRGESYVTTYYVNDADKRAVEVHMANLRRKIGDSSATPRFIETVRGVGYRLASERDAA